MKESKYTRSEIIRALFAMPTVLIFGGISACSFIEPETFKVGEPVPAPFGCVELLERSALGDC